MNCPKCDGDCVTVDIQSKVWQRCRGELAEDGTFWVHNVETLWDADEEIKREFYCQDCYESWPCNVKVEYS